MQYIPRALNPYSYWAQVYLPRQQYQQGLKQYQQARQQIPRGGAPAWQQQLQPQLQPQYQLHPQPPHATS
jgi:hypothetical protein